MNITADAMAAQVGGRTASTIADEITALIEVGVLPQGERLPTIRSVATSLGVSVGTVAEAWSALRSRGLVETRRRGGTTVVGATTGARPFAGWSNVDFLLSSPDVSLQPPLEAAFAHAVRQPGVNAWGREHMIRELRDVAIARWPFPAEAWTSAGGGTEGLWLATKAVIEPGRPIAVEEPAAPGYLATLAELGVRAIGVPVDDDGPSPDALRAALAEGAAAFVHQPGGPYSTRHVLGEGRAEELAGLVEDSDAVVLEDDSLGPLSPVLVRTVGDRLPSRTIRVLSFCRAYGLDLRTSVVGGAQRLVERAIAARSAGVASNSRILQHALAALVRDPDAERVVDAARARYSARTELAVRVFAEAGLAVHAGPGSHVIWVEVIDEGAAALALAGRGVIVDVGRTSFVTRQETGLLRLSTAQLPEDPALVAELASLVSRASHGDLRVAFD
ncbi:PLP-dependent aminotransferase family protein [Microbacterium betulae]|uniref:PLP-dependent aminotransferase family protein n=1 Tax=Microbacterium betulae TaxID=2981139 RepID=A0AA97I661_9MICO|nr:PLP-dependent aminotransferase family protein [Microbacterium sp. AB]WOF23489.1 PLP-dependent aminotransferase family protein [Microbacterium sp. AB]